ncbi:hypothetical protein [Pimelobacter simplex]|nr:hypothetical protein [Pimelobacter simplex]GEB15906.1 hypothetical protein NSI01_42210 [Pimelobacter simplex]SFN12632.1 hypothetical protein SAMN05421671_5316 [Pimelobacter simplex]
MRDKHGPPRRPGPRIGVVAAAIALTVTSAAPALATEQSASETGPPAAVAGVLPAGADVTGVRLIAMPADPVLRRAAVGSTVAPLTEVRPARLVIKDNGFTAYLSPEQAPAEAVDGRGIAFWQVLVQTDQGTYVSSASLQAAVLPDGRSRWARPDAPTVDQSRGRLRMQRGLTRSVPVVRAVNTGAVRLSAFGRVATNAPATRAGRTAASDPQPPPGCSYRKLSTRVRSATIGTTYPVGGDTATMLVSSSTGASYGVAFSMTDRKGKWGAFKAGQSKHTQSSWGFKWTPSAKSRSYRKGVEYGLFETTCARGCVKCQRQWIPIGETGGTGANTKGVNRPTWTKCAPVVKGQWWRDRSDGRAYDYNAGVKFAEVIGIDLSVNRQYNRSQKLVYHLKKARRMCGSDGVWASKASKVMARLR